ncbi:MAG: prepilin-type N-terminal cleavage/methylation domain-containing protein [Candidatus Paceibacterota bacterium]
MKMKGFTATREERNGNAKHSHFVRTQSWKSASSTGFTATKEERSRTVDSRSVRTQSWQNLPQASFTETSEERSRMDSRSVRTPFQKSASSTGFTLVEILLAVALLAALAGLSLPLYTNVVVRTDLAVARDTVLASATAARQRAQHNIGDGQWGVRVATGAVTVFQGSSYSSRDTGYDDVVVIADTIEVSGESEFVFAQLTGEADQADTVTLTSSSGDEVTIAINEQGVSSIQE